jgi:hypothetical protein
MTTPTQTLEHERFCLPRPGEQQPRIESFVVTRTAQDGVTHIGYARVTRCLECAAQTVEG